MDKPTLLLQYGHGWAATSPLAYTLQRLSKYAHSGYGKRSGYLTLSDPPTVYTRNIVKLLITNKLENWRSNYGHMMNLPIDLDPIRDFPKSHLLDLSKVPFTIDKYITFYKELYQHVSKKGYKAVADYDVSLDKILLYADELKEHFNLKCIAIVRDPVRRCFAKSLAKNTYPDIKQYDRNYVEYHHAIKAVVPDTHLVVMEELWEDDGTEKELLSTFLGHRIDNLWTNLYSPDIGHHLTWDLKNNYCPVPCQILGQSDYQLTPELYYHYKSQLQQTYDDWIDTFGSLPLHWGKPIDYSANLTAIL